MQYRCPHCDRELERELFKRKVVFRCPDCGGQYLTVSALRGLVQSKTFVNTLWRNAMNSPHPGVPCPGCGNRTRQVLLFTDRHSDIELDVCTRCQTVWFDPAELNSLKLNEIPEEKLSPEVKKAIASYAIAHVRETAQYENTSSGFEVWKTLPTLLGLPVEQDVSPIKRIPFITWAAAGICIAVFLFTFKDLKTVINTLGFIPKEMFRYGGITWFSSMFLHSNWPHLLGNMYFLLVFGDNVEDETGHWKYLLLLFASGFCATLTHLIFDFRSTIPCVGASGFISGILACYALLFPQKTIYIGYSRSFWGYGRHITLPAWAAFILWIALQFLGVYFNSSNSSTAYFAHLGGAASGAVAAIIYKVKRDNNIPIPDLYQKLNRRKRKQQ